MVVLRHFSSSESSPPRETDAETGVYNKYILSCFHQSVGQCVPAQPSPFSVLSCHVWLKVIIKHLRYGSDVEKKLFLAYNEK